MAEVSLKDFTTQQIYEAFEGHGKVIQLYTRELDAINGYKEVTPYSQCLLDLRDIEVTDYILLMEELELRGEELTDEQKHLTSGLKKVE